MGDRAFQLCCNSAPAIPGTKSFSEEATSPTYPWYDSISSMHTTFHHISSLESCRRDLHQGVTVAQLFAVADMISW
jgi:hypothetical protein